MTEQQQHLKDLLERRANIQGELEKIQGIIEYLTQIGVTLPEESAEAPAEEPVDEASTEG